MANQVGTALAMQLVIPDPSLVVLCGPAGSGKSTFASRHFAETAVVSSDRCRALIADDEGETRVSGEAFTLFHHIIDARLRYRRLTVADSTALSPPARQDLLKLARRRSVPAYLIVFDVSEEVCRQWNARRGRVVPPDVIHRQRQALEQALAHVGTEGFAEVAVFHADEITDARVEIARPPSRRPGRG